MNRESLPGFLLRRRAKKVQAQIVTGDTGKRSTRGRRPVARRMLPWPVVIRLNRLPRRHPERIEGGYALALAEPELGNVPAPGSSDQMDEIVHEHEGFAPVPFRFGTT